MGFILIAYQKTKFVITPTPETNLPMQFILAPCVPTFNYQIYDHRLSIHNRQLKRQNSKRWLPYFDPIRNCTPSYTPTD